MNRIQLQELAAVRARESELLLSAAAYDGAYYLVGYAVECGLKACIAKATREHDFPDRKTVDDSYSHDLVQLVAVAGLSTELKEEQRRSAEFELNWTTTKDWSEKTRYERKSKQQAELLHKAVTDPEHGVFTWLQKHW